MLVQATDLCYTLNGWTDTLACHPFPRDPIPQGSCKDKEDPVGLGRGQDRPLEPGEEKMLPQIGMPELLVLLVIIIIIFGVGRLPEVGGALGKAIREFRQSSQGLDEEKSEGEKSLQDPEGKEEA